MVFFYLVAFLIFSSMLFFPPYLCSVVSSVEFVSGFFISFFPFFHFPPFSVCGFYFIFFLPVVECIVFSCVPVCRIRVSERFVWFWWRMVCACCVSVWIDVARWSFMVSVPCLIDAARHFCEHGPRVRVERFLFFLMKISTNIRSFSSALPLFLFLIL